MQQNLPSYNKYMCVFKKCSTNSPIDKDFTFDRSIRVMILQIEKADCENLPPLCFKRSDRKRFMVNRRWKFILYGPEQWSCKNMGQFSANKNVNETTWMGHKNKSLIVHGMAPPNSLKKIQGSS